MVAHQVGREHAREGQPLRRMYSRERLLRLYYEQGYRAEGGAGEFLIPPADETLAAQLAYKLGHCRAKEGRRLNKKLYKTQPILRWYYQNGYESEPNN